MAYSDEDLRKYLLKAQEVLNSKKENQLSEADLNEIAQELGIDTDEIAKIREDYLTRGNTHLNFGNHTEAIQEFEQLLLLAPNHSEGLYGMAKAHLEKWNSQGKKADKDKALNYANQCIEIAPDYKQAYEVVSALKAKKRKKTGTKIVEKQQKPNKKGMVTSVLTLWALLLVGLAVVIGVGLGVVKWLSPSPLVYEYRVGATQKGFVIWEFTAKRHRKKQYYHQVKLTIADVASQKILKEIDIPSRYGVNGNQLWKNAQQVGERFYYINTADAAFAARHARTGDISSNKEMLSARFKELNEGVLSVYQAHAGWLRVTTKNGLKFWVNLDTNKVLNQKQYTALKKTRFKTKRWLKVYNPNNPNNRNECKLILAELNEHLNKLDQPQVSMDGMRVTVLQKGINEGKVKPLTLLEKANYFLKPKLVYGDSTHALIAYKTDVSRRGAYRLACVDKAGNVVWNKRPEDFKNPLMLKVAQAKTSKASGVHLIRHQNVLGISKTNLWVKKGRNYKRHHIALGLNLQTGNIEWQYSPTLYNTKFEKAK